MKDIEKNPLEYFRLITPFLILALGVYINTIKAELSEIKINLSTIDSRVILHLTNAELHIPRASIVSKDEFIIYQDMRDKQMNDIKDNLCEIKKIILDKK